MQIGERGTGEPLYRPTLTCPESPRYAAFSLGSMVITLNGESYELDRPVTVSALLERLEIDPRRVAIEHNLEIIRRRTFETVVIEEGDRLEIVNAVGGG